MRRNYFTVFACALPLAFSACDSIDNWGNAHMPVIGERCEHWQCFTESGRQQSQINHEERIRDEDAQMRVMQAPATPATPAVMPAPPAAQSAPAPSTSTTPTYKYVPRKPPAPGTSPYYDTQSSE